MNFVQKGFCAGVVASLLALTPQIGLARDLVLGASTEPSSIDPQFSRTGNNSRVAGEIFQRLVTPDDNLQLQPTLAESWKNVDPLTWTIKLRSGVKFHDGSPFTAEDVVFSFERAKNIPKSPAPVAGYVSAIASARAVDPLTVEVKTKKPTPELIEQIGLLFIVSKKATEGKATEDFNKGTAAIGTGPYKFKEWVPGEKIELVRNDTYWGTKAEFEKVTIRKIANGAARVVAMRTGAVDAIDAIPPADIKGLQADKNLKVFSIASGRIIYLGLDAAREESPFVVGTDGKPLKPNPLINPKVRAALAKMVDRKALVEKILDGAGEPAAQMVPEGIGGHNSTLTPGAPDIKGAKQMLADAGYPNGFGLTLHTSSDRFQGDSQIAQALGQMFSQGGIKINSVVAQPYNIYSKNATQRMFSAFIFSYGTLTPSSSLALKSVLMTFNKEKGEGSLNRTRYSNKAFDAKMNEAMAEFDPTKRNQLLAEATKIAISDTALIPIYWPLLYWATKSDLVYTANRAEVFGPSYVHLAK